MEIQPIVIGTAGHIDHGKSTLVRALTGVDPDRLKEEKERGLTIDLGFAPLTLPDGRLVGIVDVPGHERFIRNMVAGASGIDLVVLVVAADDGVMPQTREHLSIMSLLGVQRGFIALTKVDIVDPELVELAEEDVKESVAGTFLEGAPILRVSAVADIGMEAFKEHLFKEAGQCEPRSTDGVFRMPIQRVFSARGFGTIVTGIPVSGSVEVGETLEVLPLGDKGKLRGIQAYKQVATVARAGHSSALNLSDLDHNRVERGMVVAEAGFFKGVSMIAARMRALPHLSRPVANRSAVRLHTGTAEAVGELILLDSPELEPGAEGLVQFRLDDPIVCAPGDHFIARLASPMFTLGGGVILEESRHRLKRFKNFVIEELERQAGSLESPEELVDAMLSRLGPKLISIEEVARDIKRSKKETREYLDALAAKGRVRLLGPGGRVIHVEPLERALALTQEAVEQYFQVNSHRRVMDVRDLRSKLGFDAGLLSCLLEILAERETLRVEAGGRIGLAGRTLELDPKLAELRQAALTALEAAGFQPPDPADLVESLGADRSQLDQVLETLVDEGAIHRIAQGLYLTDSRREFARQSIESNCEANGQLEIPELRDALSTSRKFLIPILEYFDGIGLTMRQGGHRILRKRT